jgi:endonuclease I
VADYPEGYYDSLNGKTKGDLKSAACQIVVNHTAISYGTSTWSVFEESDTRMVDGQLCWWDMYSDNNVTVSSGHPGMNIEHGVANSWWGGTKNDAYKDLFHLNPSNSDANSRKSNYPLGVVGTQTWTNGITTVGKPASGYGGGNSMVFEPADQYKGDFARAFFYMFTCYENMSGWKSTTNWMYTVGEQYPMLKPWAYNMLIEWARQDPVDQKEIDRNEAIYKHQHNRNPFIDLPELAEYIWGNKVGEEFYVGAAPDPELYTPKEGETLYFNTVEVGNYTQSTLSMTGRGLTGEFTLAVSDDSFVLSSSRVAASSVNSGYSLKITFSPTEVGEHNGTLTITGGGLTEPRMVYLSATANPATDLEAVTAYEPTDVTKTQYKASWSAASVTPDYYVLQRTRMVDGENKTKQYITSTTDYLISDRTDSDESYVVQYSYGGKLSPKSNEIVVSASNTSVSGIYEDEFSVQSVRGGVVINGTACIYDIAGRCVTSIEAADGDEIALPEGLYIIVPLSGEKPVKMIVK